jgi:hypothetical protein
MAITVVDGLTLDNTHDASWKKEVAAANTNWQVCHLLGCSSIGPRQCLFTVSNTYVNAQLRGISGMSYPVFSGNLKHFQVMNVISSGTATMTSTTSVDAESSAFISVRFSSADPFHRAGSDEATETNSIIDQHGKRDNQNPSYGLQLEKAVSHIS